MGASFRSRWGLPDEDEGQRFQKFRARLILVVGERANVSRDDVRFLAYSLGVSAGRIVEAPSYTQYPELDYSIYFPNIVDPIETAMRLEALLNSNILSTVQVRLATELVRQSNIGFRVVRHGGEWLTYPSGSKMIDSKVVETAVGTLSSRGNKEYAAALKEYAKGEWVNAAEKTRRAIEEYLRSILNNTAGLKANIPKLKAYLKDKALPDHLRTTITGIINLLDTNYNEGSKHWSRTYGEVEAEFLIYQSGVLINLIDKIAMTGET